ncbi:hypothetical protein GUITHDRAFT_105584 [Guillardia theta CCMP2712]|uniref:SSD domain-containing protein n=1 Tax=Guillardia theta (strain CCMP2712) TaxID=905079 RepID=L1JIX0_GUITC|nr:hypothetical protein GUITHDRAFT_105584 [Guillardia theta CCMP2712]EKX48436.1 hypothetical protein GUITHDRAFT_105584 [Guillardia theta CCMP2712]|eukprot:XP_005835416.1 hypothetical protein GUITHDRAFT_105584 [Guillardia theta CCMP2712]
MAFTFIVMHSFMDKVASKASLSFAACGAIGLAIGSSFGLMGYCQVKFNPVVSFVTFLLLGLGVDDSFVLVQAYHYTSSRSRLQESLSFSHLLLFFGAFMALDAHREYLQVPWYWSMIGKGFLWPKMYSSEETPSKNNYITDQGHCRTQPETQLLKRLGRAYGEMLLHPLVSACVLVLFAGYIAVAVFGASKVGTGLDVRNLAASDSYWTIFVTERFRLFNDYGPLYLIAFPAAVIDVSKPGERTKLMGVAREIEQDSCFLQVPQGLWLRDFQAFVRTTGADETLLEGEAFYDSLSVWLAGTGKVYLKDIMVTFKEGKVVSIESFRMRFRQIPGTTTSGDKLGVPCMKQVRRILDQSYPPNKDIRPLTIDDRDVFVYWEGSAIIVEQTVLNLIYAAAACFVVTVFIIPHPILCFIAMIVVAMILVGTLASMSLISNMNIETISMIDLVLGIGFSIDNVAHYVHAFMSSQAMAYGEEGQLQRAASRKAKVAIDALERIGLPILAGDLSTMIALLALLGSKSRIFFSFFCILFAVLLLGCLHAIVLLPVVLGYFGPLITASHDEATPPAMSQLNVTVVSVDSNADGRGSGSLAEQGD